ncbi:MAG: hypothetical protein V3V99_14105 [candidate division Zixibacteria bacterium]
MKTLTTISVFIIAVLFMASVAFAGEAEKEPAKKEFKKQTHCPVMGGKINPGVYTDIQGQRVYHCCVMCTKNIKADPDKYFKKAAEENILFESVQKVCPVCKMELKDKTHFTYHEGRGIYFCNEKCQEQFASYKDKSKLLSELDSSKPDEPKEREH